MRTLLKTFTILLAALLVGCSSQPQPQPMQPTGPQRPAWIDNPRTVGEIVGLGQAGYHFSGRAAQRELATRRALDEIATQMGVTVSNITVINQNLNNAGSSTSMSGVSEHSVQNRMVNAVVHDEWREGDLLYILMVAR